MGLVRAARAVRLHLCIALVNQMRAHKAYRECKLRQWCDFDMHVRRADGGACYKDNMKAPACVIATSSGTVTIWARCNGLASTVAQQTPSATRAHDSLGAVTTASVSHSLLWLCILGTPVVTTLTRACLSARQCRNIFGPYLSEGSAWLPAVIRSQR